MSVKEAKRCAWGIHLFGCALLLSVDSVSAIQCKLDNNDQWRDQFVEVTGDFTGDSMADLFLIDQSSAESWICSGPDLGCNLHNTWNWSQFDAVAGDFNGDAYDDLFLVGDPYSWVCLGPSLDCSINNGYNWKALFDATSGDFTGDGFDDLLLVGRAGVSSPLAAPNSWLCTGPNLYCNVHNTWNWYRFDLVAGNFDGDAYDDLLLMGDPHSWICRGPYLGCQLNNDKYWKSLFEGASAHLNEDGYEDIFLSGAPDSWVCDGPDFSACRIDTENYWKTKYDIVFGDFDGDGESSAFLSGDPSSHVCDMPSVPCQESAFQPIVCEDDVSSLVPITVTTALNTSITNATFQSHSQRVVQNSNGIFLAANAASGHWVLRRSTDGGVTFTTAVENFYDTNPPALETDELTGSVYLFYARQFVRSDGEVYERAIYEKYEEWTDFAFPTFMTILPVPYVSKYTTYFRDDYRLIYFMNFNSGSTNFFILSADYNFICYPFCLKELTAPGPEARLQYPHLRMSGNTLFVAWTTSPNDYQAGALVSYRSIQVMKTEDGGHTWKTLDGAPLVTPVIADDTGPTRQIVEACDLENRTWLANFAVAGDDLHFLYLSRRGDDFQHYVRIDAASGVEEQRTAPLNGEKVSLKSLDGFFVVDGSVLYAVAEGCDRIVVFVSEDNGTTWRDYAASAPFPPDHGAYGISGFRKVTSDGFIIGAYTEFDSTPGSTNHRVMFFKVPTL